MTFHWRGSLLLSMIVAYALAANPGGGEDTDKQTLYNLSDGGVKVEVKLPCMACLRMPTAQERGLMDECRHAGGQPVLCKCFDVLCDKKVNLPVNVMLIES
eukprot:TRINITY_DN25947_c0_g1_i5.p2 TRINITY_DN25947_c0_g1~~TRINITY_DN25947_c0_g1_i5.p2  ORF type:complete len:101 (-),score=16.18 TRINITY_DN25947_c0_g1_i5:47-349(-)